MQALKIIEGPQYLDRAGVNDTRTLQENLFSPLQKHRGRLVLTAYLYNYAVRGKHSILAVGLANLDRLQNPARCWKI